MWFPKIGPLKMKASKSTGCNISRLWFHMGISNLRSNFQMGLLFFYFIFNLRYIQRTNPLKELTCPSTG